MIFGSNPNRALRKSENIIGICNNCGAHLRYRQGNNFIVWCPGCAAKPGAGGTINDALLAFRVEEALHGI